MPHCRSRRLSRGNTYAVGIGLHSLSIMKTLTAIVLLFALPALADKDPKTHQCTKNGVVVDKKKKVCATEGGKWELIPGKQANPKPAAK